MEEKIVDFIEELENECNEEYKQIKLEAYNEKLDSMYAITLRDSFNQNKGKYEIIVALKNKIMDLLDESEEK